MDKSQVILRYVGTGSLIEIPARDLTIQDLINIKWTGWTAQKLVDTKLYKPVGKMEKEQALESLYEMITDKEITQENKPKTEKQTKKRGK